MVALALIFLLSPANTGGVRGAMLLGERADFDLAAKLRGGSAPLGEIYAFISELYFRGKLAYARAFAKPPEGIPGSFVITPGRGLLPPELPITIDELRHIASVRIDLDDPRYSAPLERDARILDEIAGPDCRYVLLGSLATVKYIEPLLQVFGERLLFPVEFAGRGDMSRGGLMLRCAREGVELSYGRADQEARHGPRPERLPKPRAIAPEMVILIGIQAAGKTSFYRERFFDTHVRISLDLVKTRERERTLIAACLASGQAFVIDNTNTLAADRAPYLTAAKQAGFRSVGYFFNTELRAAIARNNKRQPGKIPVPAIIRSHKRLEPPTVAEGFDVLYTVSLDPENRFTVEP